MMSYFLTAGNTKVFVGMKQPQYSSAKKAWVTEKGLFNAEHAAAYVVSAETA